MVVFISHADVISLRVAKIKKRKKNGRVERNESVIKRVREEDERSVSDEREESTCGGKLSPICSFLCLDYFYVDDGKIRECEFNESQLNFLKEFF